MKFKKGKIRDGYRWYEIYNDGGLMYLYDPANTEEILGRVPKDNNYPLDAENLGEAVRDGLIVLVELFQDDELSFEIGVGNPLTNQEKRDLPWLDCAHAKVFLPSGTMRIDGANSLQLIPEEADEDGAEFKCEAGFYHISIDRVRWDELDEEYDEYEGPGEIIHLKKITKKQFTKNDVILIAAEVNFEKDVVDDEVAEHFFDRPAPVGKLIGDTIHGQVYFDDDDTFYLNLTSDLSKMLGLKYVDGDLSDNEVFEDLVRIKIPALTMDVHGCINGRKYFDMNKRELSKIGNEVATGLQQTEFFANNAVEMIRFSWDKNTRKIKKTEINQWTEATLQKD